ncbi:DNA translocase FtsK [Staphylococcus epidermidis]|uniref:FtsK/SpoIIIE domain-containing protein n=1 Tax=Staphylococcus epidermidis TaxID=1282 RepID=UPI0018874061|nr:FtsK/SpoIIIE domain-containing protein [Staphylococcus epidermidis]MBF2142469.1 DNA translocase FtsK [Staphylococcus epidermidis]
MDLLSVIKQQYKLAPTELLVGFDKDGKPHTHDLKKDGNILMGGMSAFGKTVTIHQMLLSNMYQNDPNAVQFTIYDAHRNEYLDYKELPHLYGGVISDNDELDRYLFQLEKVKEERQALLKEAGCSNLDDYNSYAASLGFNQLPHIVTVIDEMMHPITTVDHFKERLYHLSQASNVLGLHFIISTQNPKADILDSSFKTHFSSRIALKQICGLTSQIILDDIGAEKLDQQGLLIYQTQSGKQKQLQSVYTSDSMLEYLCGELR